jgi:hypothetical protein
MTVEDATEIAASVIRELALRLGRASSEFETSYWCPWDELTNRSKAVYLGFANTCLTTSIVPAELHGMKLDTTQLKAIIAVVTAMGRM